MPFLVIPIEVIDLNVMQVPEQDLIDIKNGIQEIKRFLPVFFSRMVPSHFFNVQNAVAKVPLSAIKGKVIFCLSALGYPIGFVKCVEKVPSCYNFINLII